MLKGDACPRTCKGILGWIIDTIRGTLELPPHRIARLNEIFEYLHGRTRVNIKRWHRILGELRSLAIGIPGCRGLFGALQYGFRHTDKQRINLNVDIQNALLDFKWLADDLGSRPTSIAELVPDHPVAIGPHDASGFAMGGCWLPAVNGSTITPTLWRCCFPSEVAASLITDNNPNGMITNSDLELAGQIAHLDVFSQRFQCAGRTVVPLGDNISSVSWSHKGSTTTLGPTGYLLRLLSLHQRHFRYLSKADYISGPANRMADDLSRLIHLPDAALLTHFNVTYPQDLPWTIAPLRPEMLSLLTSALQKKRGSIPLLLNAPNQKTITGASGRLTVKHSVLTPTFQGSNQSYLFSRFSPQDYEEVTSIPADNLSKLGAWRTTYAPSARRSPAWGPTPTPALASTVCMSSSNNN